MAVPMMLPAAAEPAAADTRSRTYRDPMIGRGCWRMTLIALFQLNSPRWSARTEMECTSATVSTLGTVRHLELGTRDPHSHSGGTRRMLISVRQRAQGGKNVRINPKLQWCWRCCGDPPRCSEGPVSVATEAAGLRLL